MATEIHQLPSAEFWIVWMLAVAGAVAAFIYAFGRWRRARIIEDAPTAKVRSAHQGYLELEGNGRMMEGEPIISPLTGKHCLWFQYKVERREVVHHKGQSQTRWRTIEQGVSDALFLLVDDTGQCVIDPEGAEVTPLDKLVWYGNAPRPMNVPLLGGGGIGFGGDYRYTETFIMEGQPLYAIGLFKTVSAIDGYSSAEIARDYIRAWKKDQKLLLNHFDHNRDGKIDVDEWQKVQQVARRKADAEFKKRSKDPDIHVMRRPKDGWHPYLLSAYPQEGLTRRYRHHAFASIVLFFSLGAAVMWALGVRLGPFS